MVAPLTVLDQVRVASPCKAAWGEMQGDERVRHCALCNKNVFNLSGMSRDEATALVQGKEGRLCVTYFRRPDGTMLTQDCPVGRSAVRRKWALVGGVIAAVLGVGLGGALMKREEIGEGTRNSRLRQIEPFKTVLGWLFPTSQVRIMGEAVYVPPPSNGVKGPSNSAQGGD